MAQVSKQEAIAALREANPSAKAQDLELYANAWMDYQTAQANIDEHGTIVFHPKTGAPIENPFFKIRAAAAAQLQKIPRLKTDALWSDE